MHHLYSAIFVRPILLKSKSKGNHDSATVKFVTSVMSTFVLLNHLCIFLKIRLLESVQLVAAEIPIPENVTEPVVLSQRSFAVSVQEEFESQALSVSLGDNPFSDNHTELSEDSLIFSAVKSSTASIALPRNLYDSLPASYSLRITHLVFLNDALFLRRNDSSLKVGSIIISPSIENRTVEGLDPPISLTFLKNPVSDKDILLTMYCQLSISHSTVD